MSGKVNEHGWPGRRKFSNEAYNLAGNLSGLPLRNTVNGLGQLNFPQGNPLKIPEPRNNLLIPSRFPRGWRTLHIWPANDSSTCFSVLATQAQVRLSTDTCLSHLSLVSVKGAQGELQGVRLGEVRFTVMDWIWALQSAARFVRRVTQSAAGSKTQIT